MTKKKKLPPPRLGTKAKAAMKRILQEKRELQDTEPEPQHEQEDEPMEQTIKWVGIAGHEYVSRCGHFKARKRGTNWALFVRNDPGVDETYTDAEHTAGTFKALKQTCEELKAGDDE